MNRDFWISRWEQNQIGFHQDAPNPYLQAHIDELALAHGDPVFVPLCGKSLDMIWLRDAGYRVIGVELSEVAAAAFFEENDIVMNVETVGRFAVHSGDGIELLVGDYFDLRAEHLAGTRAVYDRASLIALPPPMRTKYAAHMARLLPPEARVLAISIEYPAEQMQGPPFTVAEDEVRSIFADTFTVELLASADALDDNPRFRARGLTSLTEKVFLLERLA